MADDCLQLFQPPVSMFQVMIIAMPQNLGHHQWVKLTLTPWVLYTRGAAKKVAKASNVIKFISSTALGTLLVVVVVLVPGGAADLFILTFACPMSKLKLLWLPFLQVGHHESCPRHGCRCKMGHRWPSFCFLFFCVLIVDGRWSTARAHLSHFWVDIVVALYYSLSTVWTLSSGIGVWWSVV
jgi:hypothetical protein